MKSDLVTLPNGLAIREINAHETKFLYDEIFVQQVYAAYDLKVAPGDLVLDVGANVGLFALYAGQRFPGARVWCFEPAPHCLERLRYNVAPLGLQAQVFPLALGDKDGEAEFFYYPNYSIMSGMFASETEDLALLSAGARTMYIEKYGAEPSDRELELMVKPKLADKQTFRCPMQRLSTVLGEQSAGNVTLLKVDVERAEGLVLAGIDETDWPRIDQLVIEVHDQGAAEHIAMMERLKHLGYGCELFTEPALKNSAIYVLVAKRRT